MLSWQSPTEYAPGVMEGYSQVPQVLGPHLLPYRDAAPLFETHERLDDVYLDN
jgi:hypothetical protein